MFSTEWQRAVMCPLLKRRPANVPKNWRAIALPSHMRKVVEKTIDVKLREAYKFHPAQYGFRPQHSVDTAIMRLMGAINDGCKVICVLDLEQPYASVPRRALASLLDEVLPSNLAMRAIYFLVDTLVETIRDPTKTVCRMQRGVPEGSPVSLTLFNVDIDGLAAVIVTAANEGLANSANFFDENVVLMAKSMDSMQDRLDVCTNWAAGAGLKWCVAKSSVLLSEGIERRIL